MVTFSKSYAIRQKWMFFPEHSVHIYNGDNNNDNDNNNQDYVYGAVITAEPFLEFTRLI